MNNQKGVTLISLIVYVVVMIIVLGIMSSIITIFYSNTNSMNFAVQEMIKFNKFNICFLKEIKSYNNSVDRIDENNYILFTSGNSFCIKNNSIYYNNIKLCDGVQDMTIKKGKDGDNIDNTIINVNIKFKEFSKIMNYKIENIY